MSDVYIEVANVYQIIVGAVFISLSLEEGGLRRYKMLLVCHQQYFMSEDTIWCNARVKLHNRKTDERDSVEKREFLAKRNHKYSQSFHLNKFFQ